MGKKKDKFLKFSKKIDKTSGDNPEPESNPSPEHVTTEPMTDLINTLIQRLELHEESTRQLGEQIAQNQNQNAQNQKALRRHNTIFRLTTIILGAGIIAVGYVTANTRYHLDEDINVASPGMDKITLHTEVMSKAIVTMSNNMNEMNTSLDKISADVATMNQNINQMASDVSKMGKDVAKNPYDTRRMGRPMGGTMPWR